MAQTYATQDEANDPLTVHCCPLTHTPKDRIKFVIKPGMDTITEVLELRNDTGSTFLYKVKCTDNDLFKIRPPLGVIETGHTEYIKLTLMRVSDLPENDFHYFSVYARATMDEKTDPKKQWDDDEKYDGRSRLFVRCTEGDESVAMTAMSAMTAMTANLPTTMSRGASKCQMAVSKAPATSKAATSKAEGSKAVPSKAEVSSKVPPSKMGASSKVPASKLGAISSKVPDTSKSAAAHSTNKK